MRARDDVAFRALAEQDLPMLHEWLRRPHVAQWWGEPASVDELREDFIDSAHAPRATRAFIAGLRGRDIGFIQCYCVMGAGAGWWPDETDPGARGIDQFLGEAADLGKGLGRAMIGSFLEVLFADPAVTVVQTDPDPANHGAIRCYLACGFQPQGRVDTPDGEALLLKRTRRPQAEG